MVEEEIRNLVNTFTAGDDPAEWDLKALYNAVNTIFPLPRRLRPEDWVNVPPQEIADHLVDLAYKAYDQKEQTLGAEKMRQLERLVMLKIVDERWMRHLTDLDALREGIGLRAIAQVDPLVAYKREAHEMYQGLLQTIQYDIVHSIYWLTLREEPLHRRPVQMRTNRGDGGAPQPARRTGIKLGRNDPCWCGSGKKYKHCHMREDMQKAAQGDGARPSRVPEPTGVAAAEQEKSSKQRRRKRRRRKR